MCGGNSNHNNHRSGRELPLVCLFVRGKGWGRIEGNRTNRIEQSRNESNRIGPTESTLEEHRNKLRHKHIIIIIRISIIILIVIITRTSRSTLSRIRNN